jgi:hypothetical protein
MTTGTGGRLQRVVRGVLLLGGLALLGFGVQGFLTEPYLDGQRIGVLLWAAGGIVLHDGVWVPLVLLVGALLVRAVPERVRGAVLVGLLTAAALTVVGLPAAIRENDHNGNATLLPLPYLRNWLLLLGVVGVAVLIAVVFLLLRTRPRHPTPHPEPGHAPARNPAPTPEAKPERKPEPQPRPNAQQKPEPDPAPERKPEPTPEAEPERKPEPQPKPAPGRRP